MCNINFANRHGVDKMLTKEEKEMIVDWFMSMDKDDLVQEIIDRLDRSDAQAYKKMYAETF